uniref:hypothetical protein n=1 Tax=Shewanella sp. TaxID=50422 RepID=UPI004047E968
TQSCETYLIQNTRPELITDTFREFFDTDNQQENIWPAGTTATVVVTGKQDRDESQDSFFRKMAHRLREFG